MMEAEILIMDVQVTYLQLLSDDIILLRTQISEEPLTPCWTCDTENESSSEGVAGEGSFMVIFFVIFLLDNICVCNKEVGQKAK